MALNIKYEYMGYGTQMIDKDFETPGFIDFFVAIMYIQ